MATENTIILRGDPNILDQGDAAAEAITPGHLVEYDSSGDVQKHGTAAANAAAMFALEREELGDDIDTAYSANDEVKIALCAPGDEVNALIPSGQNLSKGDYLESDGAGRLRALATDAATDQDQRVSVVAMSMEDSGAVTSDTRHRVLIV